VNINDITQLVNVIGDKGIWFFVVFVVYKYLGQIIGAVIIIKFGVFITKAIDGWINKYFEFKNCSTIDVDSKVSEILKRVGRDGKKDI